MWETFLSFYIFTLKYINLTKYMAKGSGYKRKLKLQPSPCTNNKQSNRHGNTAYIESFQEKQREIARYKDGLRRGSESER